MADYTTTKSALGGVYPTGSRQTTFRDVEPLLTAQQLRRRFLFGVPLVAPFPDPITGKPQVLIDDDLTDSIMRAAALAESNSFFIFPRSIGKKYPWDQQLFMNLGFLKLEERPVASLEKFEVRPANSIPGIDGPVFSVPLDWIETANLAKGQINIVPINISAMTGGQVLSTGGVGNGSFFLSTMGSMGFIPAYWYAEYTVGFPEGNVPRIINEALGQQAAILVLQQLQAARALMNSQSASIDGMSQSVSGMGGQTYAKAIELLQMQLVATMKKLKTMFGQTMFVSNV